MVDAADCLVVVVGELNGFPAVVHGAKKLRVSTGEPLLSPPALEPGLATPAPAVNCSRRCSALASAEVSVLANASNAQVARSYVNNHHAEYDDRGRYPLRVGPRISGASCVWGLDGRGDEHFYDRVRFWDAAKRGFVRSVMTAPGVEAPRAGRFAWACDSPNGALPAGSSTLHHVDKSLGLGRRHR
ncbi:MAG: hypothetical protein JWM76_4537, partial [Pseudonocardiales bacterium]|nr:hypothetical protein [Pseudonocardiales bacterium]